jgi:hypothetical protein
MQALAKLREVGYSVTLDNDTLRLQWIGQGQPDAAIVRPLLNELRNHKAEALQYLQRQAFVQDVCRQLDDYGVARFHSEKLGAVVYILRDWDDRLLTLPADALVFSLQELQSMATQSYSTEELKALATVKREILAAQRQWLAERRGTVPDAVAMALRVFPGSVVLDTDERPSDAQEPATCYACKGSDFWQQPAGGQPCRKSHPQPRT